MKTPFSAWENIKWLVSRFMCPEKKLIDKLIYDTVHNKVRWTVDDYRDGYLGWINNTLVYIFQPDDLVKDGYLCYTARGKETWFIRHSYTQRLCPWIGRQIDENYKKALFENQKTR